jgi:hypothetical protein
VLRAGAARYAGGPDGGAPSGVALALAIYPLIRYLREEQRTVYRFDGRVVPGAPLHQEVA